jgi:hypothetical protein
MTNVVGYVVIRDLPATRLFLWQLHELIDEMRVAANPKAEDLERLLDRYEEKLVEPPAEPTT